MRSLLNHLRLALRAARKNAAFTTVIVGTLALGIGANTTVFSAVYGLVLNPFPFPEPDRIVGVGTGFPKLGGDLEFWEHMAPAEYVDIRDNTETLEDVVAWDMGNRQIAGDGPVKLAVAEVQPNLRFRATAKVVGAVPPGAPLQAMVDAHGQGRCAITLDPHARLPGQQPYQGVVALHDERGEPLHDLAAVLAHYMRQSEQLDTRLVLAADDRIAAGLLIQRLPAQGGTGHKARRHEDEVGAGEDFNRIAHLAATLSADELLTLDADTVLRRLFWQERLQRFEPRVPAFACRCSRDRVRAMLVGLGRDESESILAERGEVEVRCDFCGRPYRFDAVDVGSMFTPAGQQAPGSASAH